MRKTQYTGSIIKGKHFDTAYLTIISYGFSLSPRYKSITIYTNQKINIKKIPPHHNLAQYMNTLTGCKQPKEVQPW